MKLATAVVAGCAALCLTLPAFGQATVYDTIYFNGSYTAVALGYGAGYYGGTLQIGSGPAVPDNFICDDFGNEIFSGESWQATAITFASLTTNNFSTKPPLFTSIGVNGYAAVAALAGDMGMATPPDGAGQGDISAAIWYLTAGGVATSQNNPSNGPAWSSLSTASQELVSQLQALYGVSPGDSTTAQTDLAVDALSGDSNLWLYTPTGNDIVPAGDPYPQEFIGGTVPEGGSTLLYLLLACLVCFGAVLFKRGKVNAQ